MTDTPNTSADERERMARVVAGHGFDKVAAMLRADAATIAEQQATIERLTKQLDACGANGPYRDTVSEAIEAWNRRAYLAQHDSGSGDSVQADLRILPTKEGPVIIPADRNAAAVRGMTDSAADGQARGDWVLVPRELTAENGAKRALIGEFDFVACKDALGGDLRATVPWTTIKEIHSAVVQHFSAAPARRPGEGREPAQDGNQLDRVNALNREIERWIAAVAGDGSLAGVAASECRQMVNRTLVGDIVHMEKADVRAASAEPVAWMNDKGHVISARSKHRNGFGLLSEAIATYTTPLYAAPPAPQPSDAATSGGETVQQAGVAEPRNLFWPGCRVRHHNGGEYVVLFRADYEPTMTDCYVYRGEDGHTWVRPATQMEDGRFKYAERRAEPRVMCLKCSTLVPESEADEHCERFHADAPEAAKE